MESAAAAASAKHHHHSIGFNLAVIALGLALAGLGAAYLIDAASRASRAPAHGPQMLTRTIGGAQLTIPSSWLVDSDESETGFAKQVDLRLDLPLGPKGSLQRIDVTLMPRSRVRPSAAMLDGVYLHQFMPEQLSGPPGLVGKPLMASEGYEGETVWYDPLSPSPFTAKCQGAIVEGQPGRCLRAVYLGASVAAVYSFDDTVLPNWRKFDAEMHPRLVQIGAL